MPAQTQDVVSLVRAAAKRYGVDPNFAHSILIAEGWSPTTQTSPAGAAGPMQLMPDTARGLGLRVGGGVDERYDVAKNVDAGVRYLAQLSKQYGGDPALTAMAYNGGGGAVQAYRAGRLASYGRGETQSYVNKVIPTYRRLTSQSGSGGDTKTVDNTTATGTVSPRSSATARQPKPTPNQDAFLKGLEDEIAKAQGEINDKKAALAQHEKDRQSAIEKIRSGDRTVVPPSASQAAALRTEIQRLQSALRTKTSAYNAYKGRQAVKADSDSASGPKVDVSISRGPRGATKQTQISGTPEEVAAATASGDFDLGDGVDTSGAMTDYQAGQLDIDQQKLELEKIKAAYSAGQLSFDKAKYMIDHILGAPAVSTVNGERYEAGYEPGSGMLAFAKKYGVSIDPKKYKDIDYAGLLGMPEANKYVHDSSNPFTDKSLSAAEVDSGDYRPGGSRALPGLDNYGRPIGAPSNSLSPPEGLPDAGEGAGRNAVNPNEGEVDTAAAPTPPIPPAGSPGGPSQEAVQANERPPGPMPPPDRNIGQVVPNASSKGPNAFVPTGAAAAASPTVPGGSPAFPPAPYAVSGGVGGAGRYGDLINGGSAPRVEPASRPSATTPNTLEPPSNLGMEDSGLGPPPNQGAGISNNAAGGLAPPAFGQGGQQLPPGSAPPSGPPAGPSAGAPPQNQLASHPGDDNHAKIVQFLMSKGASPEEAEQATRAWWQQQMGGSQVA